jgi:hypothetical protein
MQLGYLLVPALLCIPVVCAFYVQAENEQYKLLKGAEKKKYPAWKREFTTWLAICSLLSIPAGCVSFAIIDVKGKQSLNFIGQIVGRKMVEQTDSAPMGIPYGSHQEVYVKFTVIRPMISNKKPQTFSYPLNNLVMDENNGRFIKGKMNIGFFRNHKLFPISLPEAITDVEYCDAEETNYFKLEIK